MRLSTAFEATWQVGGRTNWSDLARVVGAGSWVRHHLLKGRGQSRGVGTNTQRVSSGEGGCVGSQGHPGFQVALASPCGQQSDGVSQALSLTRAFPAGSSQSPSPGSIPSCQQDHTCHLLQLITSFFQNAILYRLIISPFRATAPWSASWGLPAFQRCGYNR